MATCPVNRDSCSLSGGGFASLHSGIGGWAMGGEGVMGEARGGVPCGAGGSGKC